MVVVTVLGWKTCQYCFRNIYSKEKAYKIKGLPYYICPQCIEKPNQKENTK
jgi:hypothetical protein